MAGETWPRDLIDLSMNLTTKVTLIAGSFTIAAALIAGASRFLVRQDVPELIGSNLDQYPLSNWHIDNLSTESLPRRSAFERSLFACDNGHAG